jgi:hypothetical protein
MAMDHLFVDIQAAAHDSGVLLSSSQVKILDSRSLRRFKVRDMLHTLSAMATHYSL